MAEKAKKQTGRGRKQVRAIVRYPAKKARRSAGAVKRAARYSAGAAQAEVRGKRLGGKMRLIRLSRAATYTLSMVKS